MRQTRLGSWLEAGANIAVGFGVNFLANFLVLPAVGLQAPTIQQAFHIGLLFTGISLVRSYVLRRVFNRIRRLHA